MKLGEQKNGPLVELLIKHNRGGGGEENVITKNRIRPEEKMKEKIRKYVFL